MNTITATETDRGRQSWGIVVLLALAFAISYADRQYLFAAFPQLRRDLSLSNIQLGLTGSLFTWTYAAAMPLAGYMADRISRRRMVISALVLWSLATLGTSLSMSAMQLLFWRVMMGLTEALYVPAAIGIIADAHAGATRSRALSIHSLAQLVGLTIGGIYGGWSAQQIGWRHGSQSLAAIGAIYAGILIWKLGRSETRSVSPPKDAASPFEALRSIPYLLLLLTFCSFCAMLWVIYVWLPSAVHETFRLSLAHSGLASTLYLQIGSALGVLAGGVLADWAGKRRATGRLDVALWGVLGCTPFALVIFATHSLPLLRVATFSFGLCSGFFIANVFSLLYDLVARNNFGFATGFLNMVGGLGAGIAILLAGMFKNRWGISSLMLSSALCAAAAAIALLAVSHIGVGRHPRHPETS